MAEHYTRTIAAELRNEIADTGKDAARALAFPAESHDAVVVHNRARFRHLVRQGAAADPDYNSTKLDALAPPGPRLPNGTVLRAPQGVRNYHAYMADNFPEIYAAVTGDTRPLERAAQEGT